MTDDTKNDYPNLEPDTLGDESMIKLERVPKPEGGPAEPEDPFDPNDLKPIKKIPGIKKNAPSIAWGKDYRSWPISRRLVYAERLASSMNHAADVIQQDRDRLNEECFKLHERLKKSEEERIKFGDMMRKEVADSNAEKQKLFQEIVKLKQNWKMSAIEAKRYKQRLKDAGLLEEDAGDDQR